MKPKVKEEDGGRRGRGRETGHERRGERKKYRKSCSDDKEGDEREKNNGAEARNADTRKNSL